MYNNRLKGMFYSPQRNKALFRILYDENGHRFLEFCWKSNSGKKRTESIEQEKFIMMLRNANAVSILDDKNI